MPQVTHCQAAGPSTGRDARALALLALAALPLSCAADVSLEGSLGEVLDLAYTDVEVAITDSAVVVEYKRPVGDAGLGEDIVFKLVAYEVPSAVVPNAPFDLTPAPDGTVRAAVTRSSSSDPIHTLAAIRIGQLTLSAIPTLDQPVSGNFEVTFGEGGDAGKGRTAYGNFKVLRVMPGN